jgi:hypothetical protein
MESPQKLIIVNELVEDFPHNCPATIEEPAAWEAHAIIQGKKTSEEKLKKEEIR